MNTNKLTIKNKEPGKVSTGANTQLLLDGTIVKGVKSYRLECDARGVTKLTLEIYVSDVDVLVDELGDYQQTIFKAPTK